MIGRVFLVLMLLVSAAACESVVGLSGDPGAPGAVQTADENGADDSQRFDGTGANNGS